MKLLPASVVLFLLGCSLGCGSNVATVTVDQVTLPESSTGYYAFFMQNGVVLYGKPKSLAGPYISLTEVFYLRTNVDREQKKVNNVLIRRGLEPHGPNASAVAKQHIVVVEPVGNESRIMALIRDAKAGAPPKAMDDGQAIEKDGK